MHKRIKDSIPENDKAGLLALGLILLIISQALSKSTQPSLIVLRYVLFVAALVNYGYVLYVHNQERVAKKKAKNKKQE